MTIDIIEFTDEQYAILTQEQIKEIREAQSKKDSLASALAERVQAQKDALVRRGIFNSPIFELIERRLTAEFEQRVALIRDSLLFYLKYSMQPNGSESDAPYTVNYALPYETRFTIVREYYETTYSDDVERFAAFRLDRLALGYLGELYEPLYMYFRELARLAEGEGG